MSRQRQQQQHQQHTVTLRHLVLPGQVIATSESSTLLSISDNAVDQEADVQDGYNGSDAINSSRGDNGGGAGGFLRGHGTYVDIVTVSSSGNDDFTYGNTAAERQRRKWDEQEGTGNDDDAAILLRDDSNQSQPQTHQQHQQQRLVASVTGIMERTNKLLTVSPQSSSPMYYFAHVGDLIIGRVSAITSSRWKIYMGSIGCREAHLPLSGVNLPGGVQRIKTMQDVLEMRNMYIEGDLVAAEIQQIQHQSDGGVSGGTGGGGGGGGSGSGAGGGSTTIILHTRSLLKYGKLENGVLVTVPPSLIPRLKSHFVTLPTRIGVDIALGKNGFIWIQRTLPTSWTVTMSKATSSESGMMDGRLVGSVEDVDDAPLAETTLKVRHKHATTRVELHEREVSCRVRNVIVALSMVYCEITIDSIIAVYDESIKLNMEPKNILHADSIERVTAPTRQVALVERNVRRGLA